MLDSILQMVIGAGATIGYLSAWNWILQSTAPEAAEGDPPAQRRQLQRRRLAQLFLFLLLTPYMLAVFRLMAWVSATLGSTPVS